jgi:FixJ family two-component response regulator
MDIEFGTVIIVDDDPSIRESLRRLFRATGHTVRTHSSVAHLSRTGWPPGPCCLVLDLTLPGESGLAFKETLDFAGVRVPTIFITGDGDVAMAVRAMKTRPFDLLTKPFDDDELLHAVEAALEADARLLEVERRMAALRSRFETLTAREREVFFAVTRGLLNKQVASELGISEKTVKVHRSRVTEKLAADSVASLVRMADRLSDGLGDHGGAFTPGAALAFA